MLDLLDELASAVPDAKVDVYVDDVNIEISLPNPAAAASPRTLEQRKKLARRVEQQFKRCASLVAQSVDACATFFQDKHRMSLSITKSCFLASSPWISAYAALSSRKCKIKATRRGKLLGYETSAGKARNAAGIKKRIQKFQPKAARIKRLRGMGVDAKTLARATGMPSMAYGLDAVGASDTTLTAMRRAVAFASTPPTAGGNLDASLTAMDGAAGRLDPAFSAHAQPITTWARAVFCRWRPAERLAKMAMKQRSWSEEQQNGHINWALVRGPCAAAHATAARIGWKFIDYRTLVTDNGRELRLDRDSPAAVEKEVHQAVRRWRRANVAELFLPTRKLLNAEEGTTRPQRAACLDGFEEDFDALRRATKPPKEAQFWKKDYAPYLESAAAGRQWTQARVAAARHAGWATDDKCKLCGDQPGTPIHRHHCAASQPSAGWHSDHPRMAKQLAELPQGECELLITRGVAMVRIPPSTPSCDGLVEWLVRDREATDESSWTWYIDGSLIDNEHESTARLGVGIVAVSSDGSLRAAARARTPPWVRTIPAAEAWALWVVLASTVHRGKIITDCMGNVHKMRNGKQWATAPNRVSARIWTDIFNALDGEEKCDWLTWMPAHCTVAEAAKKRKSDGSAVTLTDLRANDAADALAKSAAMSHRAPERVRKTIARSRRTIKYGRALLGRVTYASQNHEVRTMNTDGEVVTSVIRDSQGKPPGNAPKAFRQPRTAPAPAETPVIQRLEAPDLTEGDKLGIVDRGIMEAARREAGRLNTVASPRIRRKKQENARPSREPLPVRGQQRTSAAVTIRQKAAAYDTLACHRLAQGLRVGSAADLLEHPSPRVSKEQSDMAKDLIQSAQAAPPSSAMETPMTEAPPRSEVSVPSSRAELVQTLCRQSLRPRSRSRGIPCTPAKQNHAACSSGMFRSMSKHSGRNASQRPSSGATSSTDY